MHRKGSDVALNAAAIVGAKSIGMRRARASFQAAINRPASSGTKGSASFEVFSATARRCVDSTAVHRRIVAEWWPQGKRASR